MQHERTFLTTTSSLHRHRQRTNNLQMLFTWDTENLCIVFSQWHIRSTASLLISLIVVVLLGVGYEALRAASRRYELSLTKQIESIPREYFPSQTSVPSPFAPTLLSRIGVKATVKNLLLHGFHLTHSTFLLEETQLRLYAMRSRPQ